MPFIAYSNSLFQTLKLIKTGKAREQVEGLSRLKSFIAFDRTPFLRIWPVLQQTFSHRRAPVPSSVRSISSVLAVQRAFECLDIFCLVISKEYLLNLFYPTHSLSVACTCRFIFSFNSSSRILWMWMSLHSAKTPAFSRLG